MPVEILELTVRASIQENPDPASTGQSAASSAPAAASPSNGNTHDIVQECVAKVMEILRHKQER